MLNFFATVFSKTVAVIAGTFIAIGGAMGGTHTTETNIQPAPSIEIATTSKSEVVTPESVSKGALSAQKAVQAVGPVVKDSSVPVVSSSPAEDKEALIKASQEAADAKTAASAQKAKESTVQKTTASTPAAQSTSGIVLVKKASGSVASNFNLASFDVTAKYAPIYRDGVHVEVRWDGGYQPTTTYTIPALIAQGKTDRVQVTIDGGPSSPWNQWQYSVKIYVVDAEGGYHYYDAPVTGSVSGF